MSKKYIIMEWAEAARKYFNENGLLVGTGWYKLPEGLGGDYNGAAVGTSPAYSFGSSVCECSVDLETGKVKIEKFTDFHDCGTPINPQAAHGQVEGAIVMGSGETIMEEVLYDEKGTILNPIDFPWLFKIIKRVKVRWFITVYFSKFPSLNSCKRKKCQRIFFREKELDTE